MNTDMKSSQSGSAEKSAWRFGRVVIASALILLLIAYTTAVVMGTVPAERKIDAVHLGLIVIVATVIVALLQPRFFERLRSIKLSGFEMEMLEQVKEKQARQELALQDIRDFLPLLLMEKEQKILRGLADGKTKDWKGGTSLRAELRRLRSMRLVVMKAAANADKLASKDNRRHVSEIKDEIKHDLADFVELTESGKRWIQRIKAIEKIDDEGD
jgi:hypothetical protein